MTQQITGELYRKMFLNAATAIENHKQEVNELNVFPVPDGDTGTNMSLTCNAAEKALVSMAPGTLGHTADVVAGALLRGARGNSGVILSLLFRGFAKSLKEVDSADAPALADALAAGVESAYNAVMKPTEGTILTVSRLVASAAASAAQTECDIEIIFEKALAEGYIALADTVNQNPVLKKAGVIDAGAKGYLYILEGMLKAMRGEMIEKKSAAAELREKADFAQYSTEDIRFAYCTEFIAEKKFKTDTNRLRDFLDIRGDSVVVVDDDEIIKVHVHTNTPGIVLTEALTYGPLLTIKIENMHEQHSEISFENTGANTAVPAASTTTTEKESAPALTQVPIKPVAVSVPESAVPATVNAPKSAESATAYAPESAKAATAYAPESAKSATAYAPKSAESATAYASESVKSATAYAPESAKSATAYAPESVKSATAYAPESTESVPISAKKPVEPAIIPVKKSVESAPIPAQKPARSAPLSAQAAVEYKPISAADSKATAAPVSASSAAASAVSSAVASPPPSSSSAMASPPPAPAPASSSTTSAAAISPAAAAPSSKPMSALPIVVETKDYCVVVVCAGAGIEEVFHDLGADEIITGGQTMNPSTEDILEKIIAAPSDVVFVLPNNKNIIMAAQQCIPLTDKRVIVIPTKSIPQGVAAMLAIDETDDIDEMSVCMAEAARQVRTALITQAARNSVFDGREIRRDEFLALLENSLIANNSDPYVVIDAVAIALGGFSPEFITVYAGSGISEANATVVADRIGSFSPSAETTVIQGGQPVYHFIISAE